MPRLSLTSLFGVDPITDDEHHFETSWILPPAILACLRGLISLYIFVTIFIFWGWYGTHDDRASIGHSFSYFTWLSYWGIGFYMLFAAIHAACYARTGHSFLLDRWPRAFRVLHSLLYVTVTTYPFLVTIVYWALLFAPPWKIFTGWQNISLHCLNSVYALLEIVLPATAPHPFIAIPFLLLMLLLYLCVAYITRATEGWYPYSFLDVGDHGKKSILVMEYCFGILAAVLVLFLVSWALVHLRRRLTHGKIKRARRDPLRAHDAFAGTCGGEQLNEMKSMPVYGEVMGRFTSSGGNCLGG
ncbi:hypothetical protein N7489_005785 [Penicillium chrysogenum]|uniref:uncharacterized protein n=1 Tax=Penicillium chrysogenum TaxID=5076 RepID=UPI0024DF079E|nr:uncharacterized protein N7489_005785 [Penicillium chrysogenum]KAJ5245689.1 hypothetical protein N7489_005785 [Penicillium chrysogenum]